MEYSALSGIKTSKSHHVKRGASVYNMNTRALGAMIHSGRSVTEMQKFFASLEVPSVSARTLEKRKRERNSSNNRKKKSCLDVTELEQNSLSSNRSAVNKEDAFDLKASYDMGWEKKGSGRAYNSRSRHGF